VRDAADVARFAALVGDPARARMLTALMSGIALTATELAAEAGVAASTASAHLAKLSEAGFLAIEKQGRHRYFRLADADLAAVLETLTVVATRSVGLPAADPALRLARVCYDHLAGQRGVWLLDALRGRHLLSGPDCAVSQEGTVFFARLGLDLREVARSRRAFARPCLDWTERRHHLGGALGAALLDRIFELGWAHREIDGRAVVFTERGERAFRDALKR
jgi:DNA-binding transcriptional ArsR family regulator